ncbi:MAG: hypothetical protein JWQ81_3041 [Amycolatopsis sp.]|jgi:hypothetical protein|nr:hypothetical protein [Amycolatopsis sp.]
MTGKVKAAADRHDVLRDTRPAPPTSAFPAR